MHPGIAAGHPATADAGLEILVEGGTAADAAVAASLASCVAETITTGLLGGGHGIHLDAASGSIENLDCFVAVPGLELGQQAEPELVRLEVPFGAELVHYAVGPASCAVPGVPAGLDALWRRHGRLPWPRLVEPALRLARDGVEMTPAQASCLAMLAPVMTMDAGERIYSPRGSLLTAGDRLEQPGLASALEAVAVEGARTAYGGTIADALLELCRERGGLLTEEDLAAYEPRWSEPVAVGYRGTRFLTRAGLTPIAEVLPRVPPLRALSARERVLALAQALLSDGALASEALLGETTNVTVVDAAGNACVLTTSLGLGSGDFLPGLDLHLNSMLGEVDLLRGRLEPGERMQSMMAPSLALDSDGLALAAGAAGGTRLRTALVTVVAGILDEGLDPQAAIEQPRLHPTPTVVNAEPGVDDDALAELERRRLHVRRWPEQHHYFGGVSAIARAGMGADPRRSGATRALR